MACDAAARLGHAATNKQSRAVVVMILFVPLMISITSINSSKEDEIRWLINVEMVVALIVMRRSKILKRSRNFRYRGLDLGQK